MQIAASAPRDLVQQGLDDILRRGANPRWIEHVARRWLRPGVGGAGVVLDLLHETTSTRLPRSWFQRLGKRVVARHGIELVDEHPVRDDRGTLLAELDLAIPALRIGLECQSWAWHGTPSARRADARRRRALRLLGWEIVELWWTDLHRAEDVLAELEVLILDRTAKLPISGS